MHKISFKKTCRHQLTIIFHSLNNFKKIIHSETEVIVVKTLVQDILRKKMKIFPKTTFTKQNRSFQAHWFVVYKWLAYNEFNDNVTCFICKKHLQELDQEKNKEDAFLRTRFRNWKKALTSFRDREQLKCHLAALTLEVIPLCLNVIAIVNLFTESQDNRIHIFGEFTEKGLQNRNNKHFAQFQYLFSFLKLVY